MLMWYTGLGVEHEMTHKSTQKFQTEVEEATNIKEDENTWDAYQEFVDNKDDRWGTDDNESNSDSDSSSDPRPWGQLQRDQTLILQVKMSMMS